MENTIKINKYLPIATLYFFVNSLFLPLGLLYTTFLTPLFFIALYQHHRAKPILFFFLATFAYSCIHFVQGVDLPYYVRSYILLLSAFIFVLTFNLFIQICHTLRTIYRRLLLFNFVLVVIACVAFFIPRFRDIFWMTTHISNGLDKFPRLKLLTYEPSYYSTLLVPIAMYYYLKILFFKFPHSYYVLFIVTLPLLLSFSLGTILGLSISLAILFFFNLKSFFVKTKLKQSTMLAVVALVCLCLLLLFLYPDNPLFTRINNIFHGRDSSFKGRTFDSFYLAWTVANKRSVFFGVGLGQVKVLGYELWRTFYQTKYSINDIAIPNAMAETLAVFGIVGVVFRLGTECYLFFKTRVYDNFYRLGLFIFIFIYQFTGSFIFNVAEYVIWILAFSNIFEEFNKRNILPKSVT